LVIVEGLRLYLEKSIFHKCPSIAQFCQVFSCPEFQFLSTCPWQHMYPPQMPLVSIFSSLTGLVSTRAVLQATGGRGGIQNEESSNETGNTEESQC